MRHQPKPADRLRQQLTALRLRRRELLNRTWPCSARFCNGVGREIRSHANELGPRCPQTGGRTKSTVGPWQRDLATVQRSRWDRGSASRDGDDARWRPVVARATRVERKEATTPDATWSVFAEVGWRVIGSSRQTSMGAIANEIRAPRTQHRAESRSLTPNSTIDLAPGRCLRMSSMLCGALRVNDRNWKSSPHALNLVDPSDPTHDFAAAVSQSS